MLLFCFCIVMMTWTVVGIQDFINSHKAEKRDEESAKRDKEYHEKRMKDLDQKRG